MSKQNPTSRYEAKITIGQNIDGTLIRKSFYSIKSKADARKKAQKWLIEHKAQDYIGIAENKQTSVSMRVWAQKWLDVYKYNKVKSTTYKSSYDRPVRLYIVPYFGERLLDDILPVDVQQFISKLEAEKSKSLCDKVLLCLEGIFETARDNELCRNNPCRNIKVTKKNVLKERTVKRVYTQQQVNDILAFAHHHKYGLQMMLLLETGIRISEMLGLFWEDIDVDRKTVAVHRTVTDDNGQTIISEIMKSDTSNRVLPITDQLANAVSERRGNNVGFITRSTKPPYKVLNNKAFTQKRYRTFFEDYRNHIGNPSFPILTPHELRHTCGTLLYEKTHDIYAVSKFLGHASIDITVKYYMHSDVEQLRDSLMM